MSGSLASREGMNAILNAGGFNVSLVIVIEFSNEVADNTPMIP